MSISIDAHVDTLKQRRVALGLTQRRLDELVGVSSCMIAKWESRHRYPTADSLDRWARALGLRLELVPTGKKRKKAS